jgi:hypothetical protein
MVEAFNPKWQKRGAKGFVGPESIMWEVFARRIGLSASVIDSESEIRRKRAKGEDVEITIYNQTRATMRTQGILCGLLSWAVEKRYDAQKEQARCMLEAYLWHVADPGHISLAQLTEWAEQAGEECDEAVQMGPCKHLSTALSEVADEGGAWQAWISDCCTALGKRVFKCDGCRLVVKFIVQVLAEHADKTAREPRRGFRTDSVSEGARAHGERHTLDKDLKQRLFEEILTERQVKTNKGTARDHENLNEGAAGGIARYLRKQKMLRVQKALFRHMAPLRTGVWVVSEDGAAFGHPKEERNNYLVAYPELGLYAPGAPQVDPAPV